VFDEKSRQFIVPYTGIYAFSVHRVVPERVGTLMFEVEGVRISMNRCGPKASNVHDWSTVLTLDKGVKVTVDYGSGFEFRGALLHRL
jgi:hypothetical protein